MIHLDTNFLVAIASLNTPQGRQTEQWMKGGVELGISVIAWTEFLTSAANSKQVRLADTVVRRVIPFGEPEADLAAVLYNFAGRKREKRLDCMIAATALKAGASLATLNQKDFAPFKMRGLVLV